MFLTKHKNGNYYVIYVKQNGKRATKSTRTKLKSVAIKRLNKFRKQYEEEQEREFIPVTLKKFTISFIIRNEAYYTEKTIKVYKSTFKYFLDYFRTMYFF